jgi:hypothetical protein
VKERPVTFSEAEVLAVLDGRKTQMRRVLEPQPPSDETTRKAHQSYSLGPMVARSVGAYSLNHYDRLPKEPGAFDVSGSVGFVRDACGQTEWTCPLGVPGDRLWVRERWALEDIEGEQRVIWHSDLEAAWRTRLTETFFMEPGYEPGRWLPPSRMPRWAARLTLEISRVRVERLQQITEADAIAEGVYEEFEMDLADFVRGVKAQSTYKLGFKHAWQRAHGGESWASDPWVWVIDFEVVS